MSVLETKSPLPQIWKMIFFVPIFVMLISISRSVDAKYLLVDLDEVQGLPKVQSRSNTNAMKIGEIRKFEIEKQKERMRIARRGCY